jgi:hypothetical protein
MLGVSLVFMVVGGEKLEGWADRVNRRSIGPQVRTSAPTPAADRPATDAPGGGGQEPDYG